MHDEPMIRVLKSDGLPEIQRPSWLAENALGVPVPIRGLLTDSVYYPASGLDSDPIMHLGHYFWSFVYADYGCSLESIQASISAAKFAGYELIGRRSVSEDDLPLARWNSESGRYLEGGNNRAARERGIPPFAEWALLVRDYGSERPRELMSLLFVAADGVTLFKKLYVETGATPACVAIIQPRDGAGDQNWTDFSDPNAYLARAVMTNPAGSPRFLLYGGGGKVEWYKQPCWPAFDKCLVWPLERTEASAPGVVFRRRRDGALSLWERTAAEAARSAAQVEDA